MRNKIYRLLLVNPNLVERSFLEKAALDRRGDGLAFKLSPALLATCKQIYQEASHVLYEENTFMILFVADESYPICPLTRYPSSRQEFTMGHSHSTLKARKWKVVIDLSADRCDAEFKYFCRLLAHSPSRILEILLIPIFRSGVMTRDRLKPLWRLRNIHRFNLSDASDVERAVDPRLVYVPSGSQVPSRPPVRLLFQVLGCESLVSKLKHVTEGNSPVELLPQMYNCLVLYFASFERYGPFRDIIEQEFKCDPDSHLGLIGRVRPNDTLQHGVLGRSYQPLSSTLLAAYATVIKNEDAEFKIHRASILEHLEPQYQRIVAASRRMATFAREQKQRGGILDIQNPIYAYTRVWTDKHYECVELLEKYADALETRDLTLEDPNLIEKQQDMLLSHYRTLPAESANRELQLLLFSDKHYGFRDLVERALDDLNTQYRIIRKARRALYSYDQLKEPGCTIGLDEVPQLPRLPGRVQWQGTVKVV